MLSLSDLRVVVVYCLACLLFQRLRANPCVDSTYRKGQSVPVGIAYWPGGLEVNWTGLHPCRIPDRETLANQGVQISFFKPSVDKLTFMRTTKADEDSLMSSIPDDKPQVLSIVAFHGSRDFVRSEARTMRSFSSNVTGGTGRVPSLTLIMRLSKGRPKYLIWEQEDCFACGGSNSDSCIAERSCAIKEDICVSNDGQDVVDLTVGCNFTMPIAFTGTDQNSEVMTSGLELKRLSKYAVSRLMSGTFSAASSGGSYLSSSGSSFLGSAGSGITSGLTSVTGG